MAPSETMETSRVVNPETGQIVIIKREERYPVSDKILMSSGFPIILLNMVFGLLPTTLHGTRLAYSRCSVAQIYALAFGLCMIILSGCFIPVVIQIDLMDVKKGKGTGRAVMILTKITHVGGFIFLLIRGNYVAKKLPKIWNQMAKLVQLSIVDLHGQNYTRIKKITKFGTWTTFFYIMIMVLTQFDVFKWQIFEILRNFYTFYNLSVLGPLSSWNYYVIITGYVIWAFCSFSHVLVSILVSFFIMTIRVCLLSTNEFLVVLLENGPNPGTMTTPTQPPSYSLLMRKRSIILNEISKNAGEDPHHHNLNSSELFIQKLNKVKDVMLVTEDVSSAISSIMGISLITEVLILIANMLANLFYILIGLQGPSLVPNGGNNNNNTNQSQYYGAELDVYLNRTTYPNSDYTLSGSDGALFGWNDLIRYINEAIIHFFFFYRLCCISTDMTNEGREPLQILKTIPYGRYKGTVGIEDSISSLKSDLASTSISLSATSYFQINKFLLTSVTGALATYIIVLLQFNAQE